MQIINPLNRSDSEEKIAFYKTEPYVIAADVYAEPKHKGRGGWTWYTGSAGWMYQFIIGSFLGIKKQGDHLLFSPCLPEEWENFDVNYQFQESTYHIRFIQTSAGNEKTVKVFLDDIVCEQGTIPLVNDGNHEVRVEYVGGG
jgi:cellobiose phosphorylase